MKLEEAIEHLETANFNYIGQLNEALEKVLEIARKNLPPMTDSEYVEGGGGKCPFCRGEDIEGIDGVEIDSGTAWQRVYCAGCERTWQDSYRLVGYL